MEAQLVDIEEVAKYIIWKCQERGRPITPKALQKVLYYVQAYSLYEGKDNEIAQEAKWPPGQPLFSEVPEAWIHGAVYRRIYNNYRQYGYQSLSQVVDEIDAKEINIKNESQKRIIDKVLDICFELYRLDANKLEALNHKEKAWREARGASGRFEPTYENINLESMKSHRPQLSPAR